MKSEVLLNICGRHLPPSGTDASCSNSQSDDVNDVGVALNGPTTRQCVNGRAMSCDETEERLMLLTPEGSTSHLLDQDSPNDSLYPSNRLGTYNSNGSSDSLCTPIPPFCLASTLPSSPLGTDQSVSFPCNNQIAGAVPVAVYANSNSVPQDVQDLIRPSIIATVGAVGINLSTARLMDTSVVSPVLGSPLSLSHPILDIHGDTNIQSNAQLSPNSAQTYLKLFSNEKEALAVGLEFYECRWLSCDRKFILLDDLVNHVNDQHVKVERPDIDYQCKWDGCPRKGKGFNARSVLYTL